MHQMRSRWFMGLAAGLLASCAAPAPPQAPESHARAMTSTASAFHSELAFEVSGAVEIDTVFPVRIGGSSSSGVRVDLEWPVGADGDTIVAGFARALAEALPGDEVRVLAVEGHPDRIAVYPGFFGISMLKPKPKEPGGRVLVRVMNVLERPVEGLSRFGRTVSIADEADDPFEAAVSLEIGWAESDDTFRIDFAAGTTPDQFAAQLAAELAPRFQRRELETPQYISMSGGNDSVFVPFPLRLQHWRCADGSEPPPLSWAEIPIASTPQ